MQRIVHMLLRLRPDVVFITGDLFDGTSANLERVAKPWVHLAPPLGAFFVAGNHEEFSGHSKYFDAVRASGIRVLDNEKVSLMAWTWSVCTMALLFIPRPSAPFCARLRSTPSALAFCWRMLPSSCGSRKRKAYPCSFPGTPTGLSSSLRPGSPLASTARSCMGSN